MPYCTENGVLSGCTGATVFLRNVPFTAFANSIFLVVIIRSKQLTIRVTIEQSLSAMQTCVKSYCELSWYPSKA